MTIRLGWLLVACLSAGAASAQDHASLRRPLGVYAAVGTLDVASSLYCQKMPSCHEDNPLFHWAAPAGPVVMLSISSAADATTVWALHRWLGKRHPRLVATGLYVAAGVRAVLVVRNIREGREARRP